LEKYHAETVRYFMLASHYRSPINYSAENLDSAKLGLSRLYLSVRGLPAADATEKSEFSGRFNEAMNDDFNTPIALSVLFDLAREINTQRQKNNLSRAAELAALLKKLSGVLGILQQDPEVFLQAEGDDLDKEKIAQLIAARNAARANKQWEQADQARQALLDMGILLEDTPAGTTYRRV
jgi:cysteinyl-tRNA synthetase